MNAFLKSVLSLIVGGVVTGTPPAIGGSDPKSVAASAIAGAAVALFYLWQHRPGAEPPK